MSIALAAGGEDRPRNMVRNTVFEGIPRVGKTKLLMAITLPRVLRIIGHKPPSNPPAAIFIDPAGEMADEIEQFAFFAGRHLSDPPTFISDHLAWTKNVPGYGVMSASTNPDPDQRRAEDREQIEETKSLVVMDDDKLDTRANPVTDRGLDDALSLYIAQKTPVDFTKLWKCFDPLNDEHHQFLRNCRSGETDLILRFMRYGRMNLRDRDYHCGPAERRLKRIGESPQLQKRCMQTFDMKEFFNRGGLLSLNGASRGNLSRHDLRLLSSLVILQAIRLARTGQLTRGLIISIDESMATGLVSRHVTRAAMEGPKWGLEIILVLHNPLTLPPDIRDDTYQLFQRRFIFCQVNPQAAKLAADLLATPTLNPLEVKFTEQLKRTVDLGEEKLPTESKSVWRDKEGEIHETINTGFTYRNIRGEDTQSRDHHFIMNELIQLKERDVRNLGLAQFFMIDGNFVTEDPQTFSMLVPPWTDNGRPLIYDTTTGQTLAEKKRELAYEEMFNRPEYQTVEVKKWKRKTAMI